MASAKYRRYGQGGMKHTRKPNPARPNGKAFKQHPKGWDPISRSLTTTLDAFKGKTIA